MRVLAIRTPEGHYLEFTTVRAELEDGTDIAINLTDVVFAQLLVVPDTPTPEPTRTNGHRETGPTIISGAGGIQSEENVRGIG